MKCRKCDCDNEAMLDSNYCEDHYLMLVTRCEIANNFGDSVNMQELAENLSLFRDELKKEPESPEIDIAIGIIASAEIDARNSNGPSALGNLSKIGKREYAVAEKAGPKLELTVKAIKASDFNIY